MEGCILRILAFMKNILLPLSVIINILLVVYTIHLSRKINQPPPIKEVKEEVMDGVKDEKGNVIKDVNIVMLGNSITYQGDWDQVLGRNDVFNGGKPGWTTQQLSWVIKNFITPNKPKICFFKGGINDYSLGIGTDRIYDNVTMILDSIANVGTIPVYTTTLYQRGQVERNLEIDILNKRMKYFCEKRGYDFLDLRPFLCGSDDILDIYIQDDYTHLKSAAYPQWASAMKPVLEKYGM